MAPTAFQRMLADAARSETREMATLRAKGVYLMPIALEEYEENEAGLLVRPRSPLPNPGEG
jgi:2-iminoacetate synthase ThiH